MVRLGHLWWELQWVRWRYMEFGANFVGAVYGSFSISAFGSKTRLGDPNVCDLFWRVAELAEPSFGRVSEFY